MRARAAKREVTVWIPCARCAAGVVVIARFPWRARTRQPTWNLAMWDIHELELPRELGPSRKNYVRTLEPDLRR
jgi:hypothetical protein